jgi:hypothetical protein
MKGQPPTIFDGTRSKTSQFMIEFQLWWMINSQAEVMSNPFSRIALCLSFIRGPRVDNWVAEKINQLRRAVLGDPAQGLAATHLQTDEDLWHNFGADFRGTFEDTASEENAYAKLKSLRMDGDQIDEYIATFEVLLARAGWQRNDKGSIDLFFNGLSNKVQRKILSIYAILPVTIDDWQAAARQVVQRYRLMDVKVGPWKFKENKPNQRSGRNPRGQFRKAHDPNAMDVDATEIDTAEINLATTSNEKGKKKPNVRCYYCGIVGHVKSECRKFKADQKEGKDEPPQKAKVRATTVEEDKEEEAKEVPPAYDPNSLMIHINKMKIEDRDDFLDRLLVRDTEGF